jgi:uncharacterized membrane protein SirB2
MSYLLLKHLHVTCVLLSGLGFLWRVGLMWRQSPLLQHRLARVLPHVVDSLLLGSALLMAWLSGQYPFAVDWLTAKFFALLAYIVFGSIALKRGRTLVVRSGFAALAVLTYVYIIGVAVHRSPLTGW